jgi:NADH-quinone oxidoreductase subunit C
VTDTADVQTPALPLDDDLAGVLAAEVGADAAAVTASRDGHGVLVVDVPAAVWTAAATFLRDRCRLDYFDWLSAVDAPDADPPGVDVVLHAADSFSTAGRSTAGPGHADPAAPGPRVRRALLRTRVPNGVPVASLTGVWPGTAWHERETFEMFGVVFDGFDDGSGLPLRKLLLTDEFEGHPLRKSFVLAARAGKPWPGAKEPGESDPHAAPTRRKTLPPGVPEPGMWGREAGAPKPEPAPAAGPAARGARGDRPPGRGDRPARTPREPRVPREPRAARPAPEPDGGAQ